MVFYISPLAGNAGGGGFPGGSERPDPPFGDAQFDFDWVFDVLQKMLAPLGSLFELMFSPMYTWLDYAFSWFGLSDEYIDSMIDNLSKMDFFQMNFFELLFSLLPIVIVISLLSWAIRAFTGPLTDIL